MSSGCTNVCAPQVLLSASPRPASQSALLCMPEIFLQCFMFLAKQANHVVISPFAVLKHYLSPLPFLRYQLHFLPGVVLTGPEPNALSMA